MTMMASLRSRRTSHGLALQLQRRGSHERRSGAPRQLSSLVGPNLQTHEHAREGCSRAIRPGLLQ